MMQRWKLAAALVPAIIAGCRVAPTGDSAASPPAAKATGESNWQAGVRAKLEKRISCDFAGTPLPEVLKSLEEACGAKMVLDPAIQEEVAYRTPGLVLRLTGVPASLALDWALRLTGMGCEFREGKVFVSKPENFLTGLRTVIYDVGDLVAELPDHPATEMDLLGRRVEPKAGQPAAFVPMPFPLPMHAYDVCQAIRTRVRPESWNPGRGTAIEVRDDSLVVIQTEGAHNLIPAVLEELRNESRLALETSLRFYAVAPDKLDQVEKSGRLLAEAAARGVSGQRVHNLRGTTWPETDRRAGVFTGVLLDCRPVLAVDRRSLSLAARLALWLPVGEKDSPPEQIRVFRAPVNVRAELGRPVSIPLGVLPGAKGKPRLVVALLTVRALEPERLAALCREDPEPAWESKMKKALEKEVSFEFVERPLDDCLLHLQKLVGVNMAIDSAIFRDGRGGRQPITLRLNKVKFHVALQWVLRMGGLDYRFRDGALLVTGPDWLHSELMQKIYDVRELTDHSLDLPAPDVDEAGRLVAVEPKPAALPVAPDRRGPYPDGEEMSTFADSVKRLVEPASWGVGGTSAQEQNGLMIVFHLPEVQRRITQLLADLSLALRPEVRVDVELYSLKARAEATDAARVESGRLLSHLATVGDNRQRLHAVGGKIRPGLGGELPDAIGPGAIIDLEPTLSGDRRTAAVSARIVWVGEDLSSARLDGNLSLKVGEPTVVELGTAGGERIVAILRATVRSARNAER